MFEVSGKLRYADVVLFTANLLQICFVSIDRRPLPEWILTICEYFRRQSSCGQYQMEMGKKN